MSKGERTWKLNAGEGPDHAQTFSVPIVTTQEGSSLTFQLYKDGQTHIDVFIKSTPDSPQQRNLGYIRSETVSMEWVGVCLDLPQGAYYLYVAASPTKYSTYYDSVKIRRMNLKQKICAGTGNTTFSELR